jgi:hypothetical protein
MKTFFLLFVLISLNVHAKTCFSLSENKKISKVKQMNWITIERDSLDNSYDFEVSIETNKKNDLDKITLIFYDKENNKIVSSIPVAFTSQKDGIVAYFMLSERHLANTKLFVKFDSCKDFFYFELIE